MSKSDTAEMAKTESNLRYTPNTLRYKTDTEL